MARSRSRSPGHRPSKKHRHSDKGFKWKDKNGVRPSSPKKAERQLVNDHDRPEKKTERSSKSSKPDEHSQIQAAAEPSKPVPKLPVNKQPATTTTSEAMIIVHVNDRLGTKAAIPCLPSDPIKLFKAQVAARIGREPHEIMLRRQGERPFKDILTLADYGVSNGVQLDLELDTGD